MGGGGYRYLEKYVLLVRHRLGSSHFFLLNSIKAYNYDLKETRWEGGTDNTFLPRHRTPRKSRR